MIVSRNIKGGFLTLSGVVGIVGMIIAAMEIQQLNGICYLEE